MLVELTESPLRPEGAVHGAAAALAPPEPAAAVRPEDKLRSWSAAELRNFLESAGLQGIAATCFVNAVDGADLAQFPDANAVEQALRLTPFAAGKLLAARDRYLAADHL